jgi:hypothetical protein
MDIPVEMPRSQGSTDAAATTVTPAARRPRIRMWEAIVRLQLRLSLLLPTPPGFSHFAWVYVNPRCRALIRRASEVAGRQIWCPYSAATGSDPRHTRASSRVRSALIYANLLNP